MKKCIVAFGISAIWTEERTLLVDSVGMRN